MGRRPGPDRAPLSLLLVEDDDGDARAVTRAFKKAGLDCRITRAIDGVEALEKLHGGADHAALGQPCLLLIDLNLPRLDGIGLVKALRRDPRLSRLVVFVLTTSQRDEDRLAAYALNVAGYITKTAAGQDYQRLVELLDCYWSIVELP